MAAEPPTLPRDQRAALQQEAGQAQRAALQQAKRAALPQDQRAALQLQEAQLQETTWMRYGVRPQSRASRTHRLNTKVHGRVVPKRQWTRTLATVIDNG